VLKTSPSWRALRLMGLIGVLTIASLLVAGRANASSGPGTRAYELVSPPDKNGGDVMPYTPRTRAALDGNAVAFDSLVPFGDALGTGVTVEHMAMRGPAGWVSHAITPKVNAGSLKLIAGTADTFYDNSFSSDFTRGVLVATRPLTDDPDVSTVINLYRRTDLRTAGAGKYDLVTKCPVCASTGTPLPSIAGAPAMIAPFMPWLAAASPDMEHIVFESVDVLTGDTPAQDPKCGSTNFFLPPPSPLFCVPHAYEWDNGELRLAGVLPDGSPADVSFAGTGARYFNYTTHVVSDGTDGHSRVFFAQPTDANGRTFSEIDPSDVFGQLSFMGDQSGLAKGNVYARVDHSQTILLNRSERTVPDTFSPAWYLDASANGERVFFSSTQALTDDATPGLRNIYMYDMTKPDSAPDNLVLLNPSGTDSDGIWGLSDAGDFVYFAAGGDLRQWHDGVLHDIGPAGTITQEDRSNTLGYGPVLRQSRVTPDGRTLLFSTNDSSAFGGYDHGVCADTFPCHELYVYSAESGTVVCASCNPSGAPATSEAVVSGGDLNAGARVTAYVNRGITNDGSKVFFSTGDSLVPQDTNGKEDAYEYDVATHTVSLISTGKDPADSWYLDSSADGRDVFFATRQRLVGWDRDNEYDLYDARIGGGFPEPPPVPAPCSGGACQGAPTVAPEVAAPASQSFHGSGNAHEKLRAKRAVRKRCKHGAARRKVHGKVRCVKKKRRR